MQGSQEGQKTLGNSEQGRRGILRILSPVRYQVNAVTYFRRYTLYVSCSGRTIVSGTLITRTFVFRWVMVYPAAQHRGIWQKTFCLLLCVCSWRGPVPVVHHHDQLLDNAGLHQSHLNTFHADEDPEACCLWHWHLAMPDAVPTDSKPSSPASKTAPDLISLACSTVIHGHQLDDGYALSWLVEASAATPAGCVATDHYDPAVPPDRPGSFLASLSASSPVCALTGVSLI